MPDGLLCAAMPCGQGRTAWIVSYMAVCREPRVIRQASALRESGWRVVVFGLKGDTPCPPWWNHVEIPVDPAAQHSRFLIMRTLHAIRQSLLVAMCRSLLMFVRWGGVPVVRQMGARLYHGLLGSFGCKRKAIRKYARTHSGAAPDLVLCHDYFTADIGYWLARRFKARWSVDCHEYAAGQYAHDARWVRWHRSRVVALQAYYLEQADAVTTVCEGIARLLDEEHRLKRPARAVRSMPFLVPPTLRLAGDTITVLYHGEIYPSRGLHFAVRSLRLWRPEFRLVLRGYSDPGYVEELWRIARETGSEGRLAIEPPVRFDQIIPAASQADIGYFVHQDTSPQRRFTLPNKFFEYVMAGLALCVSDLPEMARLVRRHELGVLVADCGEEAVAAAINSLDRERINAFKRGSIEAARELNWQAEQQRMLSLYEELFQ